MKLTFTLESDGIKEAFRLLKSEDLYASVWEFLNTILRNEIKHGETYDKEALEWAREQFCSNLQANGIDLDSLYN